MKNLFFKKLLLATIVLPLAFAGCKKDDDDSSKPSTPNNNGGSEVFTFGKDGKNYDYTKNLSMIVFAGQAVIDASSQDTASGSQIVISFIDTLQTGTYRVGESPISFNYTEKDGGKYYSVTKGKLVLSSYNKTEETASGSFNFTARDILSQDSVVITNGKFKIN